MNNPIIKSYEYRNDFRKIILNHIGNDEVWVFHPLIETHVFSSEGKIKNLITGKVLKLSPNSDGYSGVNVKSVNKPRRFRLLHRLMCEAFFPYLGVDNYFYETNHIDGNKKNNKLSNLEWLTRDENLKHANDNKLWVSFPGEKNGNSKFKIKDIIDMKELYNLGFSIVEISRAFNGNRTHISKLIRGLTRNKNGEVI